MNKINGFFTDPDVSPRVKLPTLVMLFGGTLNTQKRPGGQKVIHCVVGGNNNLTQVMYEEGVNHSLTTGSCVALLKTLSKTDYFRTNADGIVKGDRSDEEILDNCKEEVKARYNANNKLLQNIYKDSENGEILGIKGKLDKYFSECLVSGDLTSDQMETTVKRFMNLVESKFVMENDNKLASGDDKKKQITAEMLSNN